MDVFTEGTIEYLRVMSRFSHTARQESETVMLCHSQIYNIMYKHSDGVSRTGRILIKLSLSSLIGWICNLRHV